MSHAYTPDTTTFHSTITVTDDGDNADHTAWTVADEGLADNAAYLHAKLSPLISGGTLTLGGDLDIEGHNVAIGTTLTVAGFSCTEEFNCSVDANLSVSIQTAALNTTQNLPMGASAYILSSSFGGNYFDARTRAPKAVTQGPLTTGTNTLNGLSYDHLYANATVAGSCTWKFVDAPPDGPDGSHHTVRLSVLGEGPVFIENAAGSSLCTISHSGTGNVPWAVIACVAGAWTLIEQGPAF